MSILDKLFRRESVESFEEDEEESKAIIHLPQQIIPKINEMLAKDKTQRKLLDELEFKPLEHFSKDQYFIPTYVFIASEGVMKPFPAEQIDSRTLVIDFGENLKKKARKVKELYDIEVTEDFFKKEYFVGVNGTVLILPKSFGEKQKESKKDPKKKDVMIRVFLMYWGEPFVRNFFSNDICDKREKWKFLYDNGKAEKDESTKYGYKIKDEFLINPEGKETYDISSFDFVKAEFFQTQLSKLIQVGITALYEEFDKPKGSIFWWAFGLGLFIIVENIVVLFFLKEVVQVSNPSAPVGAAIIKGFQLLLSGVF